MLTDVEANSLLRGLVFAAQKSRSDLMEGLGGGPVIESLLEDLQPWLFGPQNVLPQLLRWQQNCAKTGVIAGSDMFNFFKLIEMNVSMMLMILPLYGYPSPDEADHAWFAHSWPYLTDGLS